MTLSLAVYWVDIIYDITAVSHLMDGIQIHMVSIGGSRIFSQLRSESKVRHIQIENI